MMMNQKFFFIITFSIFIYATELAFAGGCDQTVNDLRASVRNYADSNCSNQQYQSQIKSLLNNMNSRPKDCPLNDTMEARKKILAGLMAVTLDTNVEDCKKNLKESIKLLPESSGVDSSKPPQVKSTAIK